MAVNTFLREPWRERGIAAFAIACALLLLVSGRGTQHQDPGPVRFDIPLVPKEAENADCASSDAVDGRRCAFDTNGRPVEGAHPLRPFTSSSGELLLVSGSFDADDLERWREQGKSKGSKRIVVRCKGTLLGRAPRVGVRMSGEHEFVPKHDVPAVVAASCELRK